METFLKKVLHRNLVYLATLADANVKMDEELGKGGAGGSASGEDVDDAAEHPVDASAAPEAAMTQASTVAPMTLHP